MSDAKKPKAKPLSLYPMSFEDAVRRAIEAGPYLAGKEFDEYKGRAKSDPRGGQAPKRRAAKPAGRDTSPAARKSAKRATGTARRR